MKCHGKIDIRCVFIYIFYVIKKNNTLTDKTGVLSVPMLKIKYTKLLPNHPILPNKKTTFTRHRVAEIINQNFLQMTVNFVQKIQQ